MMTTVFCTLVIAIAASNNAAYGTFLSEPSEARRDRQIIDREAEDNAEDDADVPPFSYGWWVGAGILAVICAAIFFSERPRKSPKLSIFREDR